MLPKTIGQPVTVEVEDEYAELTPLPFIAWQAHMTKASISGESTYVLEQIEILPKVLTALRGPNVPEDLPIKAVTICGTLRKVVPIEYFHECSKPFQLEVFTALASLHQWTDDEKKS